MNLAPSSLCRSKALGESPHPFLFPFHAIVLPRRFPGDSTACKSRDRFRSRDLQASGFTLVELSVVIAVILVLVGAASLGIKPYYAFRDGRQAGETLRAVKAAQLMYLSDNPSALLTSLTLGTTGNLTPYMPNGTTPTLPSVNGVTPTIKCTVFPPVAVLSASTYDPSGSPTDGLWDVGQY
jgi:prepilin-type N-terminal cleavage/methylation domain-containing protein